MKFIPGWLVAVLVIWLIYDPSGLAGLLSQLADGLRTVSGFSG